MAEGGRSGAASGPPHVAPRTAPAVIVAGLAACLVLLLVQVHAYWFLTDDAFISFRYARNFSNGDGLVFNPGFERVEGYSNFLWVLILAGCHRLGWAPERAANWLSVSAMLLLWTLVVAFCARRLRGRPAWLVLVPALWLAANRSFAVWATGGLETKLFELLVVAAVLATIQQVELQRSESWLPALLLGLAALTRPDGVLLGGTLLAARAAYEWWRGRLEWRAAAKGLVLFALVVGAHVAFRRLYYADWLPNTYYAKLGGESWWDMGFLYFQTLLLEYGAVVWLPLVLFAPLVQRRGGRGAAAWLIGAVIVPHALYVAYCGGDHFEYRPVDVYFPLLAVLLCEGAAWIAGEWRRPGLAAAWAGASCIVVAVIPLLTHLDFPHDYRPGFPGVTARPDGNRDLLDVRSHPIVASIPGVSSYAGWYDRSVQTLSEHFVGLRQEEHRLFLGTVQPEGMMLARMIAAGTLPADTFVALPCVGAIPYFSNLRTLDVHGLTERAVARQRRNPGEARIMAHDKQASSDYLKARHIDFAALDVNLLTNDIDVLNDWRAYAREIAPIVPVYMSKPLFDGYTFVATTWHPPEVLRRRFPALQLEPAWE
jgi:arabinofuranosyltransferase